MKKVAFVAALIAVLGTMSAASSQALAHPGLQPVQLEEEDSGDDAGRFILLDEEEDGDDSSRAVFDENEEDDDSSRVALEEEDDSDDSSRVSLNEVDDRGRTTFDDDTEGEEE